MENYKTLMKFEYTRYTCILLIFIIAFSFIASSKMIDNVCFATASFLVGCCEIFSRFTTLSQIIKLNIVNSFPPLDPQFLSVTMKGYFRAT